jgi:hypothetical protein
MKGNEHGVEFQFSEFGRKMFFEDQVNLFELHEGIQKTIQGNPGIESLQDTLTYLEERYPSVKQNQEEYLALANPHSFALQSKLEGQ